MGERNNPSQVHDTHGSARARFAAIQSAEKLSKRIILEHPEVADDYRSGLTHREIALKHEFHNRAGITVGVAREAVRLAIRNLMSDKERREIASATREKIGRDVFLAKKGLHGITPKQRMKISSKAGRNNKKNKIGLFGMSAKAKKLANLKSIHSQGKIPWIVDLIDSETGFNEVDYLIHLSKKPEYLVQIGPKKGSFNNIGIAASLNEKFHQGRNVRTPGAVNTLLYRLKKRGKLSSRKR